MPDNEPFDFEEMMRRFEELDKKKPGIQEGCDAVHDLYQGFMKSGFTESQALALAMEVLRTNLEHLYKNEGGPK